MTRGRRTRQRRWARRRPRRPRGARPGTAPASGGTPPRAGRRWPATRSAWRLAPRPAGRSGRRASALAPDGGGHGDSGKPESGYEPEEFVADALAILDAAAVDRAVVVAHSMGGAHAMLLAARHPDRVRSLVLVDVGPENMREGSERAR